MQTSDVRLQAYDFSELRTYVVASVFAAGNLLFPQLCHLIPSGGPTLLPIYFFTLIGACAFGWRVGLITAVISPLANTALFAMPSAAVLPAIMLKSVLIAALAGIALRRTGRMSLLAVTAVVLGYQTLGTLGEWAMVKDFAVAVQDFRIGLPGMLLQIVGCWLFIKCAAAKSNV